MPIFLLVPAIVRNSRIYLGDPHAGWGTFRGRGRTFLQIEVFVELIKNENNNLKLVENTPFF
jgi:hypothetical protein